MNAKKHDFCLQAASEGQREFGTFAHTPEAIALWAKTLHDRFDGPISICIELSKCPVVYALQRCPFLEIFPVHPLTLAKYREAFIPSHAKDDPTDAEMALEILLHHPDKLAPIQLQSEPIRLLSKLVEERRSLVNDVIGITNRLTNALKQYYPQALDRFEQKDTLIFCDFQNRWSTLKQVKRAKQSTFVSFFHQHNVCRSYLIERSISPGIRSATALTDDDAVIRPYQMFSQAIIEQLPALLHAIDHFDIGIDQVVKCLLDYDLFGAVSGAGHVMTPRLLVAFGEDRARYSNVAQIQRYSGLAPVVERRVKSVGYIGVLLVPPF